MKREKKSKGMREEMKREDGDKRKRAKDEMSWELDPRTRKIALLKLRSFSFLFNPFNAKNKRCFKAHKD